MVWDGIVSLANNIIGIFVDSDEVKKAKIERKVAVEQAKAAREVLKIEQKGDWENIHAEGSKNSWKDEWWALIFGCIMISAFIPELQVYAKEGFAVLETYPDWFVNILYMIIAASYGIRVPDMIKKIKKG